MIHHTKMRQAMSIGCYLSEDHGRVRIFWPQRAVELHAPNVDEALVEMEAVQNILHSDPDYKLAIQSHGYLAMLSHQTKGHELVGSPALPSSIWATLEAGEDQWAPFSGNGNPEPRREDATRINGIPMHGGEAYKEGVPAADCPYIEDSPEFGRWNDQWDQAADEALPPPEADETIGPGSVVTNRYRALYTELGHPTHCGDDLAILLNNVCQNKAGTNLELFEAICAANEVNLTKYNRTKKGWQGRLRMTGRNLLAKRVLKQGGTLKMPTGMGDDRKLSAEWLLNAEQKFKPKVL